MRSPKILIGGPRYRWQCDQRNAVMLGAATWEMGRRGLGLAQQASASSNVDKLRNLLFRQAIESNADVLLWSDGDTWIDDGRALVDIALLVATSEIAMCAVATPITATELNVFRADGVRATRQWIASLTRPEPISAAGFGIVAFNLDAYREQWATFPWFAGRFEGDEWIPEDYGHCDELARRDMLRVVVPGIVANHATPTAITGDNAWAKRQRQRPTS